MNTFCNMRTMDSSFPHYSGQIKLFTDQPANQYTQRSTHPRPQHTTTEHTGLQKHRLTLSLSITTGWHHVCPGHRPGDVRGARNALRIHRSHGNHAPQCT